MRRLVAIPMAVLGIALLTGISFAAQENRYEGIPSDSGSHAIMSERQQLKGLAVVNENGKEIGQIQDVNVDPESGALRSVTLKGEDQGQYGVAPAWGGNQEKTDTVMGINDAFIDPTRLNVGQ